jgi:hypothetical protein
MVETSTYEEERMLGDKTDHFEGKGTNLTALELDITEYLENDNFNVQTAPPSEHGTVIQAQKAGFLRGLVSADRAFTIAITGTPSDFTVRYGVGMWIQNLSIAAIETLLLSELFLPIDVADSLWSLEVETQIIAEVKKFVG